MSRDPHFDEILGVLAELGAGPEHVSAVAQAYLRRPDSGPTEPPPTTTLTCAKPTRRVSMKRKNMPKHNMPKSLGQNGHIQWRNGVARLIAADSFLNASQEMTAHYTTEDLKRRQPHVERIARGLLEASGESAAVTNTLPRKTR